MSKDIFTKERRKEVMSKIRSKNTKFELKGFEIISKSGIRFRKHPKGIFGNPDLANKTKKIAVFLDSNFWHGYNYDSWKEKLNEYWQARIEKNIQRDRDVGEILSSKNWTVIRIWEHDLKNPDKIRNLLLEV